MRVSVQAACFAADDQRHFGMDFVAEHTIHHVRARFFQAPCPFHIVRFVKTRHQFHHHGYLLARFGRRQQRFDQFGIRAGAVNRHFDGDHIGIVRRIVDKFHHRLEGLVRMVQQDVALGDFIEQAGRFAQRRRILRHIGRKFQFLARHHVGHGHQPHQIHRPVHAV